MTDATVCNLYNFYEKYTQVLIFGQRAFCPVLLHGIFRRIITRLGNVITMLHNTQTRA